MKECGPLLRRTGRLRVKTWREAGRGADRQEHRSWSPGTWADLPCKELNGLWQDLTWWNSIYEWRTVHKTLTAACLWSGNPPVPTVSLPLKAVEEIRSSSQYHLYSGYLGHCRELWPHWAPGWALFQGLWLCISKVTRCLSYTSGGSSLWRLADRPDDWGHDICASHSVCKSQGRGRERIHSEYNKCRGLGKCEWLCACACVWIRIT